MLGEQKIKQITDKVLGLSTANQTEVVFWADNSALTRFANNYIHQNVAETNTQVSIRMVMGKKIGVASTNDLSDAGLSRAVEHAATITRFQLDNPDFKSLPTPGDAGRPKPAGGFVEATAASTPEMRAEGAQAICSLSEENGLRAAGSFSTSAQELAVANSLGVFSYDNFTVSNLLTVVMGENSSGYADRTSKDVAEIDPVEVAREAVGKAVRSRDPISVEPGDYTVVLEEYAVADLLEWLNFTGGFSALALQEERSFLKKGEKITGDNVTVIDDGSDPRGLPVSIDFEGVAKRRVELIRDGVAGDPVYDSYTAGREDGKRSTGHALPAPNTFGPIPFNLFLQPGDTPKAELIKGIDRGIWVTRFHYLSVVHPLMTILTGMTRDGTFLIENSEITKPIKNLRFNQNLLEAWKDARFGSTTKLQKSWFSGSVVPAARIEKFTFASGTSF
jgi:PmbA protein